MTCEHPVYVRREAFALEPDDPSIQVRTCTACGHQWARCDGELRFGIGGLAITALFTPRDERTPEQWAALGLTPPPAYALRNLPVLPSNRFVRPV